MRSHAHNRRRTVARLALGLASLASVVALAVGAFAEEAATPAAAGALVLELKPDVPAGYPARVGSFQKPLRQDLTALSLTPRGDGRYDLRFVGGEAPALDSIDLRPFIPRIPRLARGNATLTRLALVQRELNRHQTRYSLPGGAESVFLANNCLRQGLWEVGIDRQEGSGSATTFHAWFTFPREEYARLFAEVNGVPYDEFTELLAGYPSLDRIPVPLRELRKVVRDAKLPVEAHVAEPVERLSEQARKAKLVLSEGITTYGDWAAGERQPIVTAKFSEPGFYDPADPVRFVLAWLATPDRAWWRQVKSPAVEGELTEIEVRFADGRRLLLADSRLAALPARAEKPAAEADVLRLTFGIGTPDIYASVEERAREHADDTPGYLLLLDRYGEHVDNHKAGLDRVYVWREAGDPGRLHLYLVGYERIMLAGHLSLPWRGEAGR